MVISLMKLAMGRLTPPLWFSDALTHAHTYIGAHAGCIEQLKQRSASVLVLEVLFLVMQCVLAPLQEIYK